MQPIKRIAIAFGLLLAAIPAFGQAAPVHGDLSSGGSACIPTGSTPNCVRLNVQSSSTSWVSFALDGTWSGTISFMASGDPRNTTYRSLCVTPSQGGSCVTTATAVGLWVCHVSGYLSVAMIFTTYASGTAAATITPTTAAELIDPLLERFRRLWKFAA